MLLSGCLDDLSATYQSTRFSHFDPQSFMGIGSTWEPTPTAGSAHSDATPSPGELVIIMPDVSSIL